MKLTYLSMFTMLDTIIHVVINPCHPVSIYRVIELDVSVYHVNTQEGSPSHFSNRSNTLIIIIADNQFVHVIIK